MHVYNRHSSKVEKTDEFNNFVQNPRNEAQHIQCEVKKRVKKKEQDVEYEKLRQLCSYEDAPAHLKFNPFIREGYRKELTTRLCIESMFWWTNETINIWSHVFGVFLFLGIAVSDIQFLGAHGNLTDKITVGAMLTCFLAALCGSALYHIFCCRSAKDYTCFLSIDLFGICCSMLAIYICGIVYAFWCHDTIRNFYVSSVSLMFIVVLALQIPIFKVRDHMKIMAFVLWASYGIVPTCHWFLQMGGLETQIAQIFIPRVIGMYLLTSLAFFFYITRFPERWFNNSKLVSYFGHSHNWWHFMTLISFYYWHNTGVKYAIFMFENGCLDDRERCYNI